MREIGKTVRDTTFTVRPCPGADSIHSRLPPRHLMHAQSLRVHSALTLSGQTSLKDDICCYDAPMLTRRVTGRRCIGASCRPYGSVSWPCKVGMMLECRPGESLAGAARVHHADTCICIALHSTIASLFIFQSTGHGATHEEERILVVVRPSVQRESHR